MKNKLYLSAIAALFVGIALTSCSDFLDAENKSAGGTTADDFFGKDASSLLTTAYSSLKSIVFNTDMYCRGTDLYIHTRGHGTTEFDNYTLTAENNTVKNYYSNVYKTINYANGVISYAGEESTLSQEARFLRAYGYYLLTQHFGAVPYITNYINNAETNYPRTPLNEVYDNLIADLTDLYNNSSLPAQDHNGRASKQAVAALLAKVYLAAGWDLDTSLGNAVQGTYTVNSTGKFSEAAAWAEKAINGISLTMSFEDKWSPFNEGNAEEIFSVQYDKAGYPGEVTSGGHSMQNNFGGYYGTVNDSGLKAESSDDQQSEKSMYLFGEGDLRYEGTFMTTFYNAVKDGTSANWGTEGYYAYYNVNDLKKMPIAKKFFPWYVTEAQVEDYIAQHKAQFEVDAKYANDVRAAILNPNSSNGITLYTFKAGGEFTKSYQTLTTFNNGTSNGVCVKKFDDASSDQVGGDNDYRDIVLFHVSEMYLTAAEAYFMAGQTAQALTKINAVRNRAGLASLASFKAYEPDYTTTIAFTLNDLDVILDERARELYAEGYRWMDLRRTKQLVRYNVEFNEYVTSVSDMEGAGQIKWYRPIPANEISANTGISVSDQNPGYVAVTEEEGEK